MYWVGTNQTYPRTFVSTYAIEGQNENFIQSTTHHSAVACQICEAKSGFYPLCNDCFKLRDAGKVTKCDDCGIWKNDAKPRCYDCWLKNEAQKKSTSDKLSDTNEQNSFRSKFPATMRAEDGHWVRSKAEQIIDNWLYHKNIVHAYERMVPIDQEVYCDFFIPLGQVWIEYWGSEDATYLKRKELKKKYYAANKKNLIELTDKDVANIDDVLPRKLMKYLPATCFD